MRKVLLAGILSVFFAGKVCAQLGEQRHNFAVGFNAGANLASVSFLPTFKQGTTQGMLGGFTARYISEKYFAMICGLQVEVNYSQYGWKEVMEEGDNRSFEKTLNYVEIPFLAHLAFGREYGLQGFIHAGPQIGYMISDSDKKSDNYFRTNNYNQYSNGEKAATEKISHRFDYGITAGLGVELHTRKAGSFILEGRYYMGLGDFFENGKAATFERSAHRNIVIKATYLFDIVK